MSFHEVITFKLFFLIWNNSWHSKQEPWPEMFHAKVRLRVTRIELPGVHVVRMRGHAVLRWAPEMRWKV